MRGPKPALLELNEREQEELEALVRKHSTPQQIAQRGRIILAAAQGKNNGQIARELGACVDTVRSWRMRGTRTAEALIRRLLDRRTTQ